MAERGKMRMRITARITMQNVRLGRKQPICGEECGSQDVVKLEINTRCPSLPHQDTRVKAKLYPPPQEMEPAQESRTPPGDAPALRAAGINEHASDNEAPIFTFLGDA